jgi:hypothetical protein
MLDQIIFAITFVFGPISLLTRTKLFYTFVGGILDTIYWRTSNKFMKWLDLMIFITSLGYQSIYWLYR